MDIKNYSLSILQSVKTAHSIDEFISTKAEHFVSNIDTLTYLARSILKIPINEIANLTSYQKIVRGNYNDLNEIKKISMLLLKDLFVLFMHSVFQLPIPKYIMDAEDDGTVISMIRIYLKVDPPIRVNDGYGNIDSCDTLTVITEKMIETMKTFDELPFDSNMTNALFKSNDFLNLARQYTALFINHTVFSVYRVFMLIANPDISTFQSILGNSRSNLSQEDKIQNRFLIKKFLNTVDQNYFLDACKDGITFLLEQDIDASHEVVPSPEIYNEALKKIISKHPWVKDKIAESIKIIIKKLIKDYFFITIENSVNGFTVDKHLFNENTRDDDYDDEYDEGDEYNDDQDNDDENKIFDQWGWYDVQEDFTEQFKIELKNPKKSSDLDDYFKQPYQKAILKISNTLVRTFAKDFVEVLIKKSFSIDLPRLKKFKKKVEVFEYFLKKYDEKTRSS